MHKVKEIFRVTAILCGVVVACISSVAPAIAGPVFGAETYVCLHTPDESCVRGDRGVVTFSNSGNTSPTRLLFGSINNGLTSDSVAGSRVAAPPGTICINDCFASGNASADLSAGTLKAYATASGVYFPFFPTSFETQPYLTTISQAGFEDTLTATQDGTMHFDINVSGTTALFDPSGDSSFVDGGVSFAANGHFYIGTGGEFNADRCIFAPVCAYEFDFPVSAGDAIDFTLVLEVDAGNATADFSHTLSLAVTGVTFTSDSGVFPSAPEPPPNPAPEPGTLALLGIATAGLAWRRRKQ
jgi:PEP-CTERM motif